ncbi:MAG: hypothetical protein GY851_07110 [bacterium]|nr:hypothetical protein [bacterium]
MPKQIDLEGTCESGAKWNRFAPWVFAGLAGLTALVFYILGAWVHPLLYVGVVGTAPLALACHRCRVKILEERLRERLRASWARVDDRGRNFDGLARSYRNLARDGVAACAIDDDTWADLNMDLVFAKLDRTFTLPGETMLYKTLRCPEDHESLLRERNRLVSLFQTDAVLRESVQLELLRLGRERHADVTTLLWGRRPVKPWFRAWFLPLALLPVVAACTIPLWGLGSVLFGVLPACIANLLITRWLVRAQVYSQIHALRYLGAMIGQAQTLGALKHPDLEDITTELRNLAAKVRHIRRPTLLLRPERGFSAELFEVLIDYLNAAFLVEARAFYGVLDELERHTDELRQLHLALGTLDACQSVASFREELPCYTEPEFVTGDGMVLELMDGRHPLLSKPVANSLTPGSRGVFVSGSNMSGKSTFLRTVALNAILAQTIYTCYASSYRACFFRVLSSINHADELDEGKSYYLVEAERLLKIIQAVEGDAPCLCVVDELLRGTNSPERTSASAAILRHLCQRPAFVLVASHDIELAHTVAGSVEHYHFEDRLEGGQLHFDYRLKRGPGTTRNAIKLLQTLGYPDSLVDDARDRFKGLTQHD